ncbi:hypothetical protein ABZU92_18490 [Micromonospora arida]|uniref:hypothetical protein n=1 Tax=Micromonospora arida TaxID=2203715 RepID=UPI0033B6D0AC
MSAAIKANNFADLRAQLDTATDEQLAATAAEWANRTGVIAAEYRRFVNAEIKFRAAHAALVAGMAPTTRWEATR